MAVTRSWQESLLDSRRSKQPPVPQHELEPLGRRRDVGGLAVRRHLPPPRMPHQYQAECSLCSADVAFFGGLHRVPEGVLPHLRALLVLGEAQQVSADVVQRTQLAAADLDGDRQLA